ncbi:MAG: hypothetical protein KDC98_10020 [Planctomycetes bacterium]|nr:hypothetical protein [Planctomycetota bacterium]
MLRRLDALVGDVDPATLRRTLVEIARDEVPTSDDLRTVELAFSISEFITAARLSDTAEGEE